MPHSVYCHKLESLGYTIATVFIQIFVVVFEDACISLLCLEDLTNYPEIL